MATFMFMIYFFFFDERLRVFVGVAFLADIVDKSSFVLDRVNPTYRSAMRF